MTVRIDVAGMAVPESYPEVGPRDSPPCDSAAECALLAMCLIYPQYIRALIKEDLFVLPEHRAILRAMRKATLREPDINIAEFWLAVKAQVGYGVLRVLDLGEHANPKDIRYWLARLERVREARNLIDLAQKVAERAWRMDLAGALAISQTMRPAAADVRVDIEA